MIPEGLCILYPWQYPAPNWTGPRATKSGFEVNSALSRWMDWVTSQVPIPPELFCDSKSKTTAHKHLQSREAHAPVDAYKAEDSIPRTVSNRHKEARRHTSVEAFASQISCLTEVNITPGKTGSEVMSYFVLQPGALTVNSCSLTFF